MEKPKSFVTIRKLLKKRLQHPYLPSCGKFCKSHYDIQAEIHYPLSLWPMTVTLVHVKGHQDDNDNFCYDNAPLPVRRNIDMDVLAKKSIKDPPPRLRPHRCAPIYTQQIACLSIHDNPIIANLEHHIAIHHLGPQMEKRRHTKEIIIIPTSRAGQLASFRTCNDSPQNI